MKITYKNTMQDMIDFTLYYADNFSSDKNILRILTVCIIYLWIVGTILIYLIFGIALPVCIAIGLLMSIVSIIFIPKIYRWYLSQRTVIQVNKSKNIFEDTTVILNDEGITEENGFINLRLPWKSIHKVAVTENHLFIFTNFTNSIVIPFKAFNNITEKDTFLQCIYKNINN